MKHLNQILQAAGFLFCLLLLSNCTKDEVDTMGDIHGIVSDDTGTPIQAASVTLTPTGKTTTTGSDGRYEFNDLDPQQYTVSVTKSNYSSNSKSVTVRAGETSKGDLILIQGQAQLNVSPTELIFGDADNLLSFEITNTGSGTLDWQVKEEADWISVEPANGKTTKEISTVSVKINRSNLSPNVEHAYTLNITSSNGGTKTVKVRVMARTALVVNPTQLNFSAAQSELVFTLNNGAGTEAIGYTITSAQSWIRVSPTTGEVTNKGTSIKVTVDRSGLSSGKKTGTIEVKSPQTGDLILPVSMEVIEGRLSVNPQELNFSTSKTEEYLSIRKEVGEGAIAYTLSADQSWVTFDKTSGVVGSDAEQVRVSISRNGLSSGRHTANVTVRGSGVNNVVVPVTVDVEEATLSVDVSKLDFGSTLSSLSFTLSNPKSVPISYAISKDASWLSLSTMSGSLNASQKSITVTANRGSLSVGDHTATITISYGGNRITLPVSITIKPEESYASATITSCDSRILFKIVSCKRSGGSVVLNYTIENTGMGKDITDFRIYIPGGTSGGSLIFDNEGNSYVYPLTTLGSKSSSSQTVQGVLPANVKVNASITLRDFNTAATQLSKVKMGCLAYPTSQYQLADKFFTFDNVPIY